MPKVELRLVVVLIAPLSSSGPRAERRRLLHRLLLMVVIKRPHEPHEVIEGLRATSRGPLDQRRGRLQLPHESHHLLDGLLFAR